MFFSYSKEINSKWDQYLIPSLAAVLLINEALKAAGAFPSGHCIKRHQQDLQINQSGKYTDIKGARSTSTNMEALNSSTWRTLKNDTGGFDYFDYRGLKVILQIHCIYIL